MQELAHLWALGGIIVSLVAMVYTISSRGEFLLQFERQFHPVFLRDCVISSRNSKELQLLREVISVLVYTGDNPNRVIWPSINFASR
jgi:hypothetical protein